MNKAGVVASPTPIRSYDWRLCKAYKSTTEHLPNEYTLPDEYISEVYDQLDVNACVCFAACSCAESHLRKSGDKTRLSPGFPYGRKECRKNYSGIGLYADQALHGLVEIGFVPYYLYPFLEDVPNAIKNAQERDDLLDVGKKIKPSAYAAIPIYALREKTWDAVKETLAVDKSAILITSQTYFGVGGHAVFGIGYTDVINRGKSNERIGQYIKFQNSWGKDWSGDGRGEIPLDSVDEIYVLLWDEVKLPFTDVTKKDWFYDDVRSVYLSGLVNGVSENTFEPMSYFSRGDFAIVLSRMMDKLEYSFNSFAKTKRQQGAQVSDIVFDRWSRGNLPFQDISESDYYADAVCHVYANNIVNGISDTEFAPTETITRAEVAATCVRMSDKIYTLLYSAIPLKYEFPKNEVDAFIDVPTNAWYNNYVNRACELGIIQGNGDRTFTPEKEILRCEGAAIFHRLFKLVENLMMQTV